MRRFAVPSLPAEAGRVDISGDAAHHLLRVVGVAPGEAVQLYTPGGRVVTARLDAVVSGVARLQTEGVPAVVAASAQRWLLLAQLKGPPFDTALRMATELGVTRILPVQAARSIAQGDKRARWERVVASAVQQCGRARAPEVDPPRPLADALRVVPPALARLVCVPGTAAAPAVPGGAAVMVGPEGGWTDAEVSLALDAGARPIGLGRWVLRADTAVAAALARLV